MNHLHALFLPVLRHRDRGIVFCKRGCEPAQMRFLGLMSIFLVGWVMGDGKGI